MRLLLQEGQNPENIKGKLVGNISSISLIEQVGQDDGGTGADE